MTSGGNGGDRRTTCPACGKRVVAGARYCIHCGAEQNVPTPIAAVAAASLAKGRAREAANAAHADPAPRAPDSQRKAAVAAFPKRRASVTANADAVPATRPAYDDAPSRRRLAGALVIAGVVVAVASAAVVGTRLRHESASTADASSATPTPPSATTVDAASVASATPLQPPQPAAVDAAAPATPENPPPANASVASTDAGEAAAETSTTAAPVEIKPLPPHPATTRTAHRAPSTKTAAAGEQTREEPATSVSESVQRAPSVTPTHIATQSAVGHPRDRWARMDDELSRCTREDFIARVVCGQRVRFRYCSGYWGKVSQCPGSPAPEHGQ